MGIEPTLRAWEAPVLPLNYTRVRGYSIGFHMAVNTYKIYHSQNQRGCLNC